LREGVRVRAKGLSCIIKSTITPSASSADCKLRDDGSLQVLSSSIEMGQGIKTALVLVAARELGVPIERVSIADADTDFPPYDQGTAASRSAHAMGIAVPGAIGGIKEQLIRQASDLLEVSADDLIAAEGRVGVRGDPSSGLSYEDVMRLSGV